MAALTQARMQTIERWTHHLFPLAVGNKAWPGGAAGIDQSTGKVEPMHAEADLLYIGNFEETVDATAAEAMVQIDLGIEIEVRRYANDAGNLVDAGDVGSLCNFLDDQTVTMAAGPIAGRVWDVHPTLGVAVQKLNFAVGP
jgi:hypothetical protein